MFDLLKAIMLITEAYKLRLLYYDYTYRFGTRGSGAHQFESPGGVTTTSEPNAAVIVADTGNRRVSLFRVKSDHYGEGIYQLNFFFGHQMFEAPTGVEYDPNRGLLVVADQVCFTP